MKNFKLHIKILLHSLVWIVLFLLNFLFLPNYIIRFDIYILLSTWIIFIIIFYVTAYFIMPFLFRKKLLLFMAFSLLFILAAIFVKSYTMKMYFSHKIPVTKEEYLPNQNFNPPPLLMQKELRKPPFQDRKTEHFFNVRRILIESYGVILFYLLAFSMQFILRWQKDEYQKSELEKERIKTELSFLKQQINPHFLFNSLNSIYSLALDRSKTTTDAILKLSSILRYVIYDSENSSVSLQKDIETLQDYINMHKLRLTPKTVLSVDFTGNPSEYKIEPLLLLPIIENAFKYGIDTVNDSFIDISLKITEEKLNLKVINKIIKETDKKKKDFGIGIKNLNRRLELLYPGNYHLTFFVLKNIFTVQLGLKLKK